MKHPVEATESPADLEPRRRRKTRRRHSMPIEEIVDEAVRIADADELGALTMRRLADAVGLPTMTLYGYFENKDHLLDAMTDRMLGKFVTPADDGGHRSESARLLGRGMYESMLSHPSAARLFAARTMHTADTIEAFVEGPIARLREVGYSGGAAVHIYGLLITNALGFALHQLARPWGADPTSDTDYEEARRLRKLYYESLPAERFPSIHELGDAMLRLPTREQFEWGLDIIVAGLHAADAQLAATSPPPHTPQRSTGWSGRT